MARQESVGSSVGISIQNNVVPRRPRIILAGSGRVAAHAMDFRVLSDSVFQWADIIIVVTRTFLPFIDIPSLPSSVPVYVDDTAWLLQMKPGDEMFHVVLRDWADIMVIAPLSAHTLGKIAMDLSDNLLTSIVGAWNYNKPIVVAPSMNSFKWYHTYTQINFMTIKRRGIGVINPTIPDGFIERSTDAMADPSTVSGVLLTSLVSTGWKILSRSP